MSTCRPRPAWRPLHLDDASNSTGPSDRTRTADAAARARERCIHARVRDRPSAARGLRRRRDRRHFLGAAQDQSLATHRLRQGRETGHRPNAPADRSVDRPAEFRVSLIMPFLLSEIGSSAPRSVADTIEPHDHTRVCRACSPPITTTGWLDDTAVQCSAASRLASKDRSLNFAHRGFRFNTRIPAATWWGIARLLPALEQRVRRLAGASTCGDTASCHPGTRWPWLAADAGSRKDRLLGRLARAFSASRPRPGIPILRPSLSQDRSAQTSRREPQRSAVSAPEAIAAARRARRCSPNSPRDSGRRRVPAIPEACAPAPTVRQARPAWCDSRPAHRGSPETHPVPLACNRRSQLHGAQSRPARSPRSP